jgi:hypothetical protein
MTFMPNDMLSTAYITGVVSDKPSREAAAQRYIGLSLLPWEDVFSRTVMWDTVYSENNLAGFYSPEGQAIPGDDVLFGTEMTNMIDVKAARNLDTWVVQTLREPGMQTVFKIGDTVGSIQDLKRRMTEHINSRIAWCQNSVDAQIEYITIKAISENEVVWPPVDDAGSAISAPMPHWNYNMSFTAPFNLPARQRQDVTGLLGWNNEVGGGVAWNHHATANPILDLQVATRYLAKAKGISMNGGTAIMSTVTFWHMCQCVKVLDWILGAAPRASNAQFADFTAIENAVKTLTHLNIELYDAQWTYRARGANAQPDITPVSFLKEGKVILLPAGERSVGTLMNAAMLTKENNWVHRKMGWSKQFDEPPYPVKMGVNAAVWPKFMTYDWLTLTAHTAGAAGAND